MDHPEYTQDDYLASLPADDRARMELECYGGLPRRAGGRTAHQVILGSGKYLDLLRGTVGASPEAQFGDDITGYRSWLQSTQRAVRNAQAKERTRAFDAKIRTSEMLLTDAFKVLERTSVALQIRGRPLTTMFTVTYGQPDSDQIWCTKLLSEFYDEAKGILENAADKGDEYFFDHVYAHENARDRGFHTHILTRLPKFKGSSAADFEEWGNDFFARRLGQRRDLKRFHISKPTEPKSLRGGIERQWILARYLVKTLSPQFEVRTNGQVRPYTTILKLPPTDAFEPISTAQRCGSSQSLSSKGQRAAEAEGFPIRLALRERDYADWDSGWEVEYRELVRVTREVQTLVL